MQIFEGVMDWYCENIIQGDLKVEKVRETDLIIAFKHTKPFWEHHIVVIPKKHIESLAEPEAADADLILELIYVLHELAVEFKAKWGGCHVGTNVGTYQSTKHLHWYIHSGKRIRDRDGNLIEHSEYVLSADA